MAENRATNDSSQEEKAKEAGEDRITRETSVRDACGLVADEPVVAPQGTELRDVAELLAERRGVHTVAVVDDEGRLAGVLPMRLLLDEMFLHVAPEGFLARIFSEETMKEFGKISRSQTAGELMQEPAYVTMDDTVGDVYACMHENRLQGVPIVDEDMRPIGYIDRFQLLRIWLQTHTEG